MKALESILKASDAEVTFQDRPDVLPGDLRPDWGISLILLILLKRGHRRAASLEKLHVLYWATRSNESRRMFSRIARGEGQPDDLVVRFEPALNRAIDFAVGERLVDVRRLQSGGVTVELTDAAGLPAARRLDSLSECFAEEKQFLDSLKGFVSQEQVAGMLDWGRRV
jgi:hypothetical protein